MTITMFCFKREMSLWWQPGVGIHRFQTMKSVHEVQFLIERRCWCLFYTLYYGERGICWYWKTTDRWLRRIFRTYDFELCLHKTSVISVKCEFYKVDKFQDFSEAFGNASKYFSPSKTSVTHHICIIRAFMILIKIGFSNVLFSKLAFG